jgi:formiminotetrahydrofolate cyclodeaminase
MASEQERAQRALVRAARAYHKADEERRARLVALQAAMREADAAGLMRQRIVEQSGVARQTVYDALAAGD